jgi:hypothetical protein
MKAWNKGKTSGLPGQEPLVFVPISSSGQLGETNAETRRGGEGKKQKQP